MSPRPPVDTSRRPYEVAIVGNDTLLAAHPARPMQIAHALLACGFDLVVPVSWGDEALAEFILRVVAARGAAPAIICSCPAVRDRLLASGAELSPYLISLVAPSVATARYLRALQPQTAIRVTYIGSCEGASHDEIETQIRPDDFLRLLVARGISLARQPAVFDSVVPPDRRRFFSQPGGCPSLRALALRAPDRRLVSISDDAFATEVAEYLLSGENVLLDLSSRFACICCGGLGTTGNPALAGRDAILRLEPPQATTPILDVDVEVRLDAPLGEPPAPIGEPPTPVGRSERGRARHADQARTTSPLFPPRLPGAHPMEAVRDRAERCRIAVTPSRVVSLPVASPVASPNASPNASPSASPNASPSGSTREKVADQPVTLEPVVRGAEARKVIASERDERQRTPSRRIPAAPNDSGRGTRWTDPRDVQPGSVKSGEQLGVSHNVVLHAAPGPDMLAPGAVGVSAHVRHPTPVHLLFHLRRMGTYPRAHASDGVVLPRAYVGRRPLSSDADASRADAPTSIVDVERKLQFAVEPVANGLADKPANVLVRATAAVHAPQVETAAMSLDDYPTYLAHAPVAHGIGPVAAVDTVALNVATSAVELPVVPEGPADLAPSVGAVDEAIDDVSVVSMMPVESVVLVVLVDDVALRLSEQELSPDAVSDDATMVESLVAVAPPQGPVRIAPDMGARVREHVRRVSPVAPRHVAPPPKPRELGSLIVLVASVVVVLALIIAFAVILRRAPTEPW